MAGQLRRGPPSISALVGMLGSLEGYAAFISLVREYLPDHEAEILREHTPGGQVAVFASHFRDRYFPLHPFLEDGDVEGYGDLTSQIHADVCGICSEDHYAPEDFSLGYRLMIYLIDSGEPVSIPLAEACRQRVPDSILENAVRLSREELHHLLDGTRFEGLACWADIWEHDTGLYFLDASFEDLWYESIDWSIDNVRSLTEEWQRAEVVHNQVGQLAGWLEEQPANHFKEMTNFIEDKRKVRC